MQHGFDTIAHSYDAQFTRSRIGSAQRELVRGYLRTLLPERARWSILELGCGTGEDAAWFARMGHRVTATDASQAMLEVADAKLTSEGVRAAVDLRHLRAEEVRSATIGAPYDLIFSNFGGLNCLPPSALARLAPELRALLAPQGRLVVVVMPPFCLWETLYFLLKGNPADAFRRGARGPVQARVAETEVPVWYYSSRTLANLLGEGFRLAKRRPVGFAVPPSYLESFVAGKPRFFRALAWADGACAGWPFLAAASDHALFDFEAAP